MPVDKVYYIEGRGSVAASKIERGTVKLGETVELVGYGYEPLSTVVTGIEIFGKPTNQAQAGDDAGLLLRGIQRGKGYHQRPGSCQAAECEHLTRRFEAEVYVLTKEEVGGTTFLYRLQAAVLLPNRRHHRRDRLTRECNDGDARG